MPGVNAALFAATAKFQNNQVPNKADLARRQPPLARQLTLTTPHESSPTSVLPLSSQQELPAGLSRDPRELRHFSPRSGGPGLSVGTAALALSFACFVLGQGGVSAAPVSEDFENCLASCPPPHVPTRPGHGGPLPKRDVGPQGGPVSRRDQCEEECAARYFPTTPPATSTTQKSAPPQPAPPPPPTTPKVSTAPNPSPNDDASHSDGGLSGGEKVGIAVGVGVGVAGVALIACGACVVSAKSRNRVNLVPPPVDPGPPTYDAVDGLDVPPPSYAATFGNTPV